MTDMTTADIIADDLKKVAEASAQIVLLAVAGDYIGAGKRAAELAIDLVPPELLREHLTAAGIQLANEAADALEDAKVGPKP